MDEQQHETVTSPGQDLLFKLIGTAIIITATVLAAQMERKASDPDWLPQRRMRLAKAAERFCATSAAGWWHLAERARLAYERERP